MNTKLKSLETSCKKLDSGLISKASQQNLALNKAEPRSKMSEDFNDSVKSLNLVDTKLNSVDENVQLKFEVFKVDSTIEGIIIVYFESPNSIYVR